MRRASFRASDFRRYGVTESDVRGAEPPITNHSWSLSEEVRDRAAVLLEAHGLDPDREVIVKFGHDGSGFELFQSDLT